MHKVYCFRNLLLLYFCRLSITRLVLCPLKKSKLPVTEKPELTPAEEDYLKAIFTISEWEVRPVSTGAISRQLNTAPASVTDMLHKLALKQLISYQKYRGVSLTLSGIKAATSLIRRNRLWRVFLVQKLRFAWHQVDEIAGSLEHLYSPELISRLDAFLDYPRFDPFGDPIPNAEGKFTIRTQTTLLEMPLYQAGTVLGVKDQSPDFLVHLSKLNIKPGAEIKIIEKSDFDQAMKVVIDSKHEAILGKAVSQLILMKKN